MRKNSTPQQRQHHGDPRLAAAWALLDILPEQLGTSPAGQAPGPTSHHGHSLREVLPRYRDGFNAQDSGLITDLCFGVCRYWPILHAPLASALKKPLKTKDRIILALLLCGTYELAFTDKKPHAIIHSYPDSCRRCGRAWASGLVNALLRRIQRRLANIPETPRDPDTLYTALTGTTDTRNTTGATRYALPDWLYARIHQDWPEHTDTICRNSLMHPPFCVRVNPGQEGVVDHWQQQGLTIQPAAFAPQGYYLTPAMPVARLAGFSEGQVSVQDEAAQLPAQLMRELITADTPLRLLDACAAPGGKTNQLCTLFPAASLLALDRDAERLTRVHENLQRSGHKAELVATDATAPDTWFDGSLFDGILLDAPCSATGILRRQPDIKWHRQPGDIASLTHTQQHLLHRLWPLLKPGGVMVYATCSILRDENDRQISTFLAHHPDATDVTPIRDWGLAVPCGRQLLPQANGHDGFYLACLRKQHA